MKNRILFVTVYATHVMIVLCIFLCSIGVGICLAVTASNSEEEKTGRLAIVIDDFGLQRKGVYEMLSLDCKLTAAIMPFLEYSEEDAEDALENGKEVIIHIPMQATTHDIASHLGPRPIRVGNSEEEIRKWIDDAIFCLPEAVGANIHMGTLSSSKESIIQPVMEELKKREMFFLDSKTSSKSVCKKMADKTGVVFFENDVFLEHESKNKGYIKKRLRKAMKIAKDTGSCIAIGHVGYEGGVVTAEAIDELLDEFAENNVQLVFLSELSR